MRKSQLLYYSMKYNGDHALIKKALARNESFFKVELSCFYLTILDPDYPEMLLNLHDPPYVLYYIGNKSFLKQASMSIVGSRTYNTYGFKTAKKLASFLKKEFILVSGLASGIDSLVHLESLTFGRTIAVLGCGFNHIYPSKNLKLFREISEKHLVISEYPPHVKAKKHYFLARNRIIAALGMSLIVVQARLRSGTMSTVNFALELGKDVYAVPHAIDDEYGRGCNQLINDGALILLNDYEIFDKTK